MQERRRDGREGEGWPRRRGFECRKYRKNGARRGEERREGSGGVRGQKLWGSRWEIDGSQLVAQIGKFEPHVTSLKERDFVMNLLPSDRASKGEEVSAKRRGYSKSQVLNNEV